ncbi:MAG: hypothetical protein HUJ61_00915, partial [Bacilli bacterium]|nr:hypothetical protein [Bacilli bacterium]
MKKATKIIPTLFALATLTGCKPTPVSFVCEQGVYYSSEEAYYPMCEVLGDFVTEVPTLSKY